MGKPEEFDGLVRALEHWLIQNGWCERADVVRNLRAALEAAESRAEKAEAEAAESEHLREYERAERQVQLCAQEYKGNSVGFIYDKMIARGVQIDRLRIDRDEWKSRALAAEAKGPTMRERISTAIFNAMGGSGWTYEKKAERVREGMASIFGDEKETGHAE